jgi:hypothetical protein
MALNIYYPLPKMNSRKLFDMVSIYISNENPFFYTNSVHFFLKDFQDRSSSNYPPFSFKKNGFSFIKKKTNHSQEIEKEWSKLSPLLIQLHLFHNPLTFLSIVNLNNDSSWNFIHYFPLNPKNQMILNNSKYYAHSMGLFLLPHSFYLSNLQSADLILSLYDTLEEQTVYLTLFALLVQNHKGSFVLKLNTFHTPLMMDLLYLLSCVYNKVIILPVDYVYFYVICKGFQIEFLRPHYEQIKTILHILRPNSLQKITNKEKDTETSPSSSLRLFSKPLPSIFTSKIEEINVLIYHKQLLSMND